MSKISLMRTLTGMMIITAFICFPGCGFIEDVFKAGIWVGVIIVIAILAVVILIIKMFSK